MPRRYLKGSIGLILLTVLSCHEARAALASQPAEPGIQDREPFALIENIVVEGKRITSAQRGEVEVLRAQTGGTELGGTGMRLYLNDEIRTGPRSQVTIHFLEESAEKGNEVITFDSRVRIARKNAIVAYFGSLFGSLRGPFDVVLQFATLGARGTEFELDVTEDGLGRLTVLEGDVEVKKGDFITSAPKEKLSPGMGAAALSLLPEGGSRISPPTPATQPEAPWRFEAVTGQRRKYDKQLKLTNHCTERREFEIQATEDSLPIKISGTRRKKVDPGQSATIDLTLEIDSTRSGAGTHEGNLFVVCRDCQKEPGCEQDRISLPVEIVVTTGGMLVQRLQETAIGPGPGQETPRPASDEGVRSVLKWTNAAMLEGQPSYAAKGIIPHFATPAERSKAFAKARSDAILNQSPGSYETLGWIYSDWGEGAKARAAYKKELRRDPAKQRTAGYLTNQAEASRLTGRLPEAQEFLKRALEIDPSWAPGLNALGNVYSESASIASDKGDSDTARELLRQSAGAYEKSVQAAAEGPRNSASRAIAWTSLGEVSLARAELAERSGNYEEARTQIGVARRNLGTAGEIYPQYAFITLGMGKLYQLQGRLARAQGDPVQARASFTDAERQYKQALQSYADLAPAHLGLGSIAEDRGDTQGAISSFTRAIELRPIYPSAFYRLGRVLERVDPKRSGDYFRTFMRLEPAAFSGGERGRRARERAEIIGSAPSLLGMSEAGALEALARNQLRRGRISTRPDTARQGTVIEQRPPAGTRVAPGSTVDFTVAVSGPIDKVVPNVVGLVRGQAEGALSQAGFRSRVEYVESDGDSPETVLRQSPPPHQMARPGTEVKLWIARRLVITVVPRVVGLSRGQAERLLSEAGLRSRTGYVETDGYPSETVVKQSPQPQQRVRPGTEVTLWISRIGRQGPIVPNVVGMSRRQAESVLAKVRLRSQVRYIESRGSPDETVLGQSPPAGQQVQEGSIVVLSVPRGQVRPSVVQVPDVVGMSRNQAENTLSGLGLRVRISNQATRAPRPGTVMRQSPTAGRLVPLGTTVILTVAVRVVG